MPSLIDTHSHIYVAKFAQDIDQVLERARQAGVEKIIVPATKPLEFEPAFALAEQFPEVEVAVGVHPHHAGEVDDRDLEEVERLAGEGRAIAIGEIGIDYYYEYAPRERQHEVFRRQLKIAKRLGLPVVVHNRESDDDLLKIIEEEQDGSLRFQLHCFSSDIEILRRSLDLGAMISFTGNITYSKGALDDVVRTVPDDRIMIETDAPYLTPVPYRGRRNEPSYVLHVAEKVAELRGKSLKDIALMTTANARRFFGLTATLLSFITLCAAATAQNLPADLLSIDRSAPLPALQGEVLQGEAPTAADTTVKTERAAYDKWFGIGACLASTSIINGAITDANAVLGYGLWLTITPLQSLKVDWFQLDLTYTYSRNTQLRDSLYEALTKQQLAPPNDHKQLGINARFIGNPKSIVNFYATIGMTYFHNEFGLDRWVIENITETQLTEYVEDAWGLSGSLGVSVNVSTPYGVIAPTAEWYVGRILGDRPLPQRQGEFFLSQPRIGLLFYPSLSKLF